MPSEKNKAERELRMKNDRHPLKDLGGKKSIKAAKVTCAKVLRQE